MFKFLNKIIERKRDKKLLELINKTTIQRQTKFNYCQDCPLRVDNLLIKFNIKEDNGMAYELKPKAGMEKILVEVLDAKANLEEEIKKEFANKMEELDKLIDICADKVEIPEVPVVPETPINADEISVNGVVEPLNENV